jgi:hypothetical protein
MPPPLTSYTRTAGWRVGWQDADTELSAAARQKQAAAEGGEEEFRETLWTLYDIGGDARVKEELHATIQIHSKR